ncbi:unnamed protein product [Owenia fusiformis]|uniref:Uncharacterized protein n=1 Tax=Owenia fusiformis TaxID=6347 RepID=A0A8J1U8F9_OWEFU|nr:unnamed protein product [Owenia fusiformis]
MKQKSRNMGKSTDVAEEKDCDSVLQSAFKQLKVDTEWKKPRLFEESEHDPVTPWTRHTKKPALSSKRELSPPLGKAKSGTAKRKSDPYPLSRIDKLTLTEEKCSNKSCHCNKTIITSGASPELNYAKLCKCEPSAKTSIIREARLKITREKDRSNVIRSARLKYHKAKQSKLAPFSSKLAMSRQKSKSPTDSICPRSSVFGASFNPTDFSSVATDNLASKDHFNKTKSCDLNEASNKPTLVFPNAVNTSGNTPSEIGQSPGNSPTGTHTRSCSQEARLDEMSVDELAYYFEDFVYIPKSMSSMAEMMYT